MRRLLISPLVMGLVPFLLNQARIAFSSYEKPSLATTGFFWGVSYISLWKLFELNDPQIWLCWWAFNHIPVIGACRPSGMMAFI